MLILSVWTIAAQILVAPTARQSSAGPPSGSDSAALPGAVSTRDDCEPAQPRDAPARFHVRSTDRRILELIEQGCNRSSTFRTLVATLGRTDTFVYIEPGLCGFGHLVACLPHTVALGVGARYVTVLLDQQQTARRKLAAIAHELQHALEVAYAPEVRTTDDLGRLFRRIGYSPHCPPGLRECYETHAALKVGQTVEHELDRRSTDTLRR